MEIATQLISIDKTVRSKTVNDLSEFNFQSLTTQVKKRRTIGKHDACF